MVEYPDVIEEFFQLMRYALRKMAHLVVPLPLLHDSINLGLTCLDTLQHREALRSTLSFFTSFMELGTSHYEPTVVAAAIPLIQAAAEPIIRHLLKILILANTNHCAPEVADTFRMLLYAWRDSTV